MNWYLGVLKNYVTFSGRARRTEYWMYVLFTVIISIVLGLVDGVVFGGGSFAAMAGSAPAGNPAGVGVLGTIYTLATFLPSLAVSVRRLHDTGRSGWWMLIGLVPLIGAVVLVVFFVLQGTRGPNSHGADPKAVAMAY